MQYDLSKLTPDIRYLNDIRAVLFDKNFAASAVNSELYLMYRKVSVENNINHNITVILAKMLGKEFMKTKGHVHIGNFQEVYTVLEGEAIFLMQKGNEKKIDDVYAVKAQKGESIIIPAGYGHITINPSKAMNLKTGDWTSANCKSDYSLFEKMRGACCYYTSAGWIKNENYKSVPKLRFEESLKSIPENLDFLKQG